MACGLGRAPRSKFGAFKVDTFYNGGLVGSISKVDRDFHRVARLIRVYGRLRLRLYRLSSVVRSCLASFALWFTGALAFIVVIMR